MKYLFLSIIFLFILSCRYPQSSTQQRTTTKTTQSFEGNLKFNSEHRFIYYTLDRQGFQGELKLYSFNLTSNRDAAVKVLTSTPVSPPIPLGNQLLTFNRSCFPQSPSSGLFVNSSSTFNVPGDLVAEFSIFQNEFQHIRLCSFNGEAVSVPQNGFAIIVVDFGKSGGAKKLNGNINFSEKQ